MSPERVWKHWKTFPAEHQRGKATLGGTFAAHTVDEPVTETPRRQAPYPKAGAWTAGFKPEGNQQCGANSHRLVGYIRRGVLLPTHTMPSR